MGENEIISVAELLSAHHKYASTEGLKDNFGDGYLMHHNPIFRNIRKEALRQNVTFTHEDFCDYFIFPLTALVKILEQNKVPYIDNASPLQRFETSYPKMFNIREMPLLRANYIQHECCHIIANRLISKARGQTGLEVEQEQTLFLLMGEAYANTCDAIGNSFTDTKVHETLYKMSSYIHYNEGDRVNVSKSFNCLGPIRTFKFVYYSYLFSNFLLTELTDEFLHTVLLICDAPQNISAADKDMLCKAFNIGMGLNKGFRTLTNSFYFKLQGLKKSHDELLNFNFLKITVKNKVINQLIEDMGKIAMNEIGVQHDSIAV